MSAIILCSPCPSYYTTWGGYEALVCFESVPLVLVCFKSVPLVLVGFESVPLVLVCFKSVPLVLVGFKSVPLALVGFKSVPLVLVGFKSVSIFGDCLMNAVVATLACLITFPMLYNKYSKLVVH